MSEPGHTEHIIGRHLMIHGRVQGVHYRASSRQRALELKLAGWVRNRRSGAVEALVAGPETAVQAFIKWAHNGPSAARVDRIDITPTDVPDANTFEQRATE